MKDTKTAKDYLTNNIKINRWLLTPIGAWPRSLCEHESEKIIMFTFSVISCSLIGFLLFPAILATILNKDENFYAKIRMIGPLSFCLMAGSTMLILLSRGSQITRCVRHMEEDRKSIVNLSLRNEDKIIIENAKFGRFLAIFCACFMYSGGIFFTTIMPLVAKRTEIIDNVTVRSVSFPIYRGLMDPRDTPYFEIVQSLQCLAGYIIYSITIGSCSLAAIFVMHACGQLKIVMSRLELLVDGWSSESGDESTMTLEQRINDIIKRHLRTLSFISWIEQLLNEIFCVEFIGCTLNICLLGYYLMMEWQVCGAIGIITYCILLLSFTFNIFILCYIGELLTMQCKNVGLASYVIDWYRLPNKKAMYLIMMIAASESSPKLTAGKFVELSLVSFCSVIKSSIGYLNLLRTLTN